MKRRIRLLLCVLVMALSFVGCAEEKISASTKETLETSAEIFISSFSQMSKEDLESFKAVSDFQLDYIMMYNSLPTTGENFIGLVNSWQAAQKECGKYMNHGEYKIEAKSGGYEVSTIAEYENKEAAILFVFDEQLNVTSMDVSAKISMKEILTKAGLNTVLGMGTVFVVLIFLAFLISLMKYIPILLERFENQKHGNVKENQAEPVQEMIAEPVTQTYSDVSDDTELVAVIAAAIAAMEGTSTDGFVVRSIRRRPSNNW